MCVCGVQVVQLVVDMCTGVSLESLYTPGQQPPVSATNTITTSTSSLPEASNCRVRKTLSKGVQVLNPCRPLQVGGLAHPLPPHLTHALTHAHLAGCIRNLRINGQVSRDWRTGLCQVVYSTLLKVSQSTIILSLNSNTVYIN